MSSSKPKIKEVHFVYPISQSVWILFVIYDIGNQGSILNAFTIFSLLEVPNLRKVLPWKNATFFLINLCFMALLLLYLAWGSFKKRLKAIKAKNC